jgi:hypothetical protein
MERTQMTHVIALPDTIDRPERMAKIMAELAKIEREMAKTRKMSAEFELLSGKSYTTGTAAELQACALLDWAWVPTEGYDAIDVDGQLIQIKSRIPSPKGTIERIGRFDLTKRWDVGAFVEKDYFTFEVTGIWTAPRAAIAAEIERDGTDVIAATRAAAKTGKAYKVPRRQQGALIASDFKRLATHVWPKAAA